MPALGDRILVMGRWIIDCGHPNYGTADPMAFLAWTHTNGATTVTHTYYNPYWDTEAYSTDSSVLGKVNDTNRFAQAKPFPPFLVSQVLAALSGSIDHLSSDRLVAATHTSPAPWQGVRARRDFGQPSAGQLRHRHPPGCAGGGDSRVVHAMRVSYNSSGPSYRPLNANIRECVLPWGYLSQIAQASYGTSIDLRGLIDKFVSSPSAQATVNRDPGTSCAERLPAAPNVASAPTGQQIRVDAGQAFPFYGVIAVKLS